MPLEAILTVGWPLESPDAPAAAKTIHQACMGDDPWNAERYDAIRYRATLLDHLQKLSENAIDGGPVTLTIGRLFRRRPEFFRALQRFIGHLNSLLSDSCRDLTVQCEIDVFAYAFLKGAKNFDLFFPEAAGDQGAFRKVVPIWCQAFEELKRFERNGNALSCNEKTNYLALRQVMVRPSARDERRALATLLVSGPSSPQDICDDLGMTYHLADRILPTFRDIQVLTDWQDDIYVIRQDALPRVVFCLREIMGLDLLSLLNWEC